MVVLLLAAATLQADFISYAWSNDRACLHVFTGGIDFKSGRKVIDVLTENHIPFVRTFHGGNADRIVHPAYSDLARRVLDWEMPHWIYHVYYEGRLQPLGTNPRKE